MQKNVRNTNVVFGIGVFEDETCFEQISVLFLYLFEIHCELFFFLQFTHLKHTFIWELCLSAGSMGIIMFSHN